MKRITMIGDVGWSRFYHLGDEAMTELAIDELRARADIAITLIAGQPQHASEMYGVDAVRRIGFRRDRRPNTSRMKKILDYVAGDRNALKADDPAIDVIEAVRNSAAVLIAGGGNLNSMFAQHIYERATLAKIARALGKPYALTSQTLGPLIYDEDRDIVHDLLAEAEFVGTRESYTTQLVDDLGRGSATVRRQVDDAFSLTARDEDRSAVSDLTERPFILASFAEKASTPMLSDDDYHARLAELTRRLAEDTGLWVLLVPHGGALPPAPETRDQLTDPKIARGSGHAEVVPTRMLTARELIALTEQAQLVVGTRYHAAIFAGAAGVPLISLAPNLYSSIRMRGAAENVGMEDYVLPLDSVDDIVSTAVGAVGNRDELTGRLSAQSQKRRAEHQQWWDFVVAKTLGDTPGAAETEAPGFFHAEAIDNPYVDDIGVVRERLNAVQNYGLVMALKDRKAARANEEVQAVKSQLQRLRAERDEARRRDERREAEPAVRAARRVESTGRRTTEFARRAYRRLRSARR